MKAAAFFQNSGGGKAAQARARISIGAASKQASERAWRGKVLLRLAAPDSKKPAWNGYERGEGAYFRSTSATCCCSLGRRSASTTYAPVIIYYTSCFLIYVIS